jgi:hypothetical protein
MRLTASQHEHLQELSIALARPTADSDVLVQRGLAERGKGKFGEWVRITAKGKAEADSRMTRDRGARAASTVSLRSAKTKDQSMPAAATPLPSAPTRDVPPASRLSQQPAPIAASMTQRAQQRTARITHSVEAASSSRRPSEKHGCSSGQASMVDAIRRQESAPFGGKTLRIYQVHYIDDRGKSLGFTWHRSEREARSEAHKRKPAGLVASHDIGTNKEGIIDALTRFASHPR